MNTRHTFSASLELRALIPFTKFSKHLLDSICSSFLFLIIFCLIQISILPFNFNMSVDWLVGPSVRPVVVVVSAVITVFEDFNSHRDKSYSKIDRMPKKASVEILLCPLLKKNTKT